MGKKILHFYNGRNRLFAGVSSNSATFLETKHYTRDDTSSYQQSVKSQSFVSIDGNKKEVLFYSIASVEHLVKFFSY